MVWYHGSPYLFNEFDITKSVAYKSMYDPNTDSVKPEGRLYLTPYKYWAEQFARKLDTKGYIYHVEVEGMPNEHSDESLVNLANTHIIFNSTERLKIVKVEKLEDELCQELG